MLPVRSTTSWFVIVLASVAVGASAVHGRQDRTPESGVIAGQVTGGSGDRPVPGALVTLSAAPSGIGAASGDKMSLDQLRSVSIGSVLSGVHQIIADGQGRFAFTGLRAGGYSVAASKPGWNGGAFGQRRPDGSASPLELAAGAHLTGVDLRLWKNAALGGLVVDEHGEAIIGATVRALRRTWLAGHPRYVAAGAAETDDRGMYRVSGLRPGDYIVAVPQTAVTLPAASSAPPFDPAGIRNLVASNGPATDPSALLAALGALAGNTGTVGIRHGDWQLRVGGTGTQFLPPGADERGRLLAYRSVFYPTAPAAAEAVPIHLESGDERLGIDFVLRPSAVVRLAGVASGPDGSSANLTIRLRLGDSAVDDAGLDAATATTDAQGGFEFLGVTAGDYVLEAIRDPSPGRVPGFGPAASASLVQNGAGNRALSFDGPLTMEMILATAPVRAEPTLWASVPVVLADADQTSVSLPLRNGFRVNGRAIFDGSAAKPSGAELARMPITLDRADAGAVRAAVGLAIGQPSAGRFDEAGQFTTREMVPGRYFVTTPFAFAGWTLSSVSVAGREATDDPIEVRDADVVDVVLVFTDRTSELSGTVHAGPVHNEPAISVVMFPTQTARWIDFGSHPRRLRVAQADSSGHYTLTDLPAGDYFVAAVAGDVGSDWQNPEYLESLSRAATRTTIAVGEKKTLDLVAR